MHKYHQFSENTTEKMNFMKLGGSLQQTVDYIGVI